MLEVLREDYIRTARSKGLQENIVIVRHALRNALIPVVTLAGFMISLVIGGTVVIESIFSLPGMGLYLVRASKCATSPSSKAWCSSSPWPSRW